MTFLATMFRVLGLLALLVPGLCFAATCTSSGNRNWDNSGGTAWTGAGCGAANLGPPAFGDAVIIRNSDTITIPTGVTTANVATLRIGSNPAANGAATLTLAGTATLNVSGAVTIVNSGNNNIDMLNVQAGTANLGSLTLDNSGSTGRTVQLALTSGTVNVTGGITFTNANINVKIVFAGLGTLNIGGDLPSGGGATGVVLTQSTGTVNFNGTGAQNIGVFNNAYNNLSVTKSSGTATLLGTASVGGNLAVTCPATCTNGTLDLSTFTANRSAAGGTLTVGSGATMKIGGTQTFPTNYGTRTLTGSTVEYSGTAQTVQVNAPQVVTYTNLTLSGSGTKTLQASALTLAGTGNFTMSGTAATTATAAITVPGAITLGSGTTFSAATFTHNVAGDFTNNGATFNANTSTFNFNGASAQTIGGSASTSFNNMTVANTAGLTINKDTTVAGAAAGALTLTNSVITTGSSVLITSQNCTTANLITRNTTGHINGNLQLKFPSGAQTCTFHVGDSAVANYTPVAITFTSVSGAGGSLIGSTTAGDYSDANIPVNPLANVQRYWTLTLPGSGPLSFTGSYGTTYTYRTGNTPAGDNDDASFAANYVVAKGDACSPCTWTLPTMSGTPTSTSASTTGITSGFSVHVVGRRVRAANSTVVASPTVVPANGTSTSTITVTLKDPAGNVISGRTVSLSAGGGSSTITTLSGTSDVNGQATFSVKDSTVESVTYTATSEGLTITQTATVEFAPTSFNAFESSTTPALTAVTGQLYTKKISTGFTIDVVAVNNAGTRASTFGGTVRVDLVTGQSGGACSSVATGISATQDLALSSSGRGTTAALTPSTATAYKDVRVRIRYPASLPVVTTCSLDNFAIRPLNFTVTSSASNTGSSGAPAIKTGVNFNLTATSSPGYDLQPSIAASPVVVGAGLTAGTLGGSFGTAAVVTGAATGNFTYSEVGNFGLIANAVFDTAFTAVDPSTDCTNDFNDGLAVGGKYGCKIGSSAVAQTTGSSGFGRFIPDHFALTAPGTVTQACSSGGFSYMGQNAGLSTVKIEARNSSNAKTLNYDNNTLSYAKLDATTASNFNFAARDTGGAGTNLATSRITATTSGTWTAGELTLSVGTLSIGRLASTNPDGPYDATKVAIAPKDSDDIVLQTGDFNVDTDAVAGNDHAQIGTDTKWRFGRLRLQNANGSQLIALPIPISAQYWNGSGFVTNTLDNCTTFAVNHIAIGNPQPVSFTVGAPTVGGAFTAGIGTLRLPASGAGATGSVDVSVNLTGGTAGASCTTGMPASTGANLAYLQGAWCGATYVKDPTARATFGVYKNTDRFIYQRENF